MTKMAQDFYTKDYVTEVKVCLNRQKKEVKSVPIKTLQNRVYQLSQNYE